MATPIENNTAGLEEILRTVNTLPAAGGGSGDGGGLFQNLVGYVNMSGKYQTRTISKTFSSNGGNGTEHMAFLRSIVEALIDMGAPLNANDINENSNSGAVGVTFLGEASLNDGGAFMSIYSTGVAFVVEGYGRNGIMTNANRFTSVDTYAYAKSTSQNARIDIHAVKSGDSFYFGFCINGNDYATINFAITPMKRLSAPSVSIGYALVAGTAVSGGMPVVLRTLPHIDGFNYDNGYYNGQPQPYAYIYPAVDSGKIVLTPFCAGIEDVYYDKVYVSPMRRGYENVEKAFSTDTGTFLISGFGDMDWTIMGFEYCQLAFDITDAV